MTDSRRGYHFLGIGGAGVSGLARLMLGAGHPVSGSDQRSGVTTGALERLGAVVSIGHSAENLPANAGHLVYSAAVASDNPELVEARRRGIPVLTRAEMLALVMRGKTGIAIAGTHGKTTTSGMTSSIFLVGGADPSILIGGDWPTISGNARAGAGRYFIAEACEAFDSFLELSPDIAALTNVEADHLDWYGSLAGVLQGYRRFLHRVTPDGMVIGCGDDENVRLLLAEQTLRTVTFGLGSGQKYTAEQLDLDRPQAAFDLLVSGKSAGRVKLGVPGVHNVLNALAASAIALECGLSFAAVRDGLLAFTGVGRRFETLRDVGGIRVMDDYAHHPTEAAATLAAARRAMQRHLTVVFQPHLYSRTQLLLEEFSTAFVDADRVWITEIYGAREEPIEGVSGQALAERVQQAFPSCDIRFCSDRDEILNRLAEETPEGGVVMTMGAGDIRELGERLVERLKLV